jgi:glycerol-3-phosphate acyltransferase PlsY
MPNEVYYAAAGVFTYLVGAIPFGWLLVKATKGVDLREVGSKNIGATNAGRLFGFHYFLVIFLLDLAKGFLPVFFISPWIAEKYPCDHCPALRSSMAAFLALCSVVGHMFPVYLGFRGGKGVATGLGVALALSWQASAIAFGGFLLMLLASRYVSVSSIFAALVAPTAHHFVPTNITAPPDPWGSDLLITIFFIASSLLVLFKHRTNVKRLFAGTEPKLFSKKA